MGVTTDKLQVEKISAGGNGERYDKNIIDVADFFERVVAGYNEGSGPGQLPADLTVARSLIPAGTAALRDFSYIAPDVPQFHAENCVGCMECVVECPDTAILGKVVEPAVLEEALAKVSDDETRSFLRAQWTETNKYYKIPQKKGEEGGLFGIFVDPTKCKGCAECVEACGDHNALSMIQKGDDTLPRYKEAIDFFRKLPETPERFIQEKVLADMMLAERALLYVGGAGSCAGCGEATAIRMLMAAMGFAHGAENVAIVAATGCNTVYGSTYPYNPFLVPWTNSLFENAPTDAMGVRLRWNQIGWQDKKLWVLGGDGAMYDIGFQSLSRMMASGLDINVMVLDTQVYSNTGGQASTASYTSQEAQMAAYGRAVQGKVEHRKEIGRIAMMHPDTFVASTTAAHINHFYRAVLDAASFPGPSVVVVYTTCQPEHGVGDNMSYYHAKLAVNSRAFPLFIYDPRKGRTIKERLSLKGNPAVKEDWYKHPKTGEQIDFIYFARTEARFRKQFDKDGNPAEPLLTAQKDRLQNWHLLQEMAGIR
jgi:pyruvate/2-oxoacid:ferredoxin oxidoreductase beta subunit/NAD-dependent dihydropyrimidine dehydrogenase PreA subunit